MVPRIVEGVKGADPWFSVSGRKQMDVDQEELIRGILDWQLDQAKFGDRHLEKAVRTMLIYNFCAFFTDWEIIEQDRVTRVLQENQVPGGTEWSATLKLEPHVQYEGPSLYLVDPYDFFVDLDADDVEDALFIGHSVWYSFEQLKNRERTHGYYGIDRLRDMTPRNQNRAEGTRRYYKIARAQHYADDSFLLNPDGSPKEFKTDICYCKFDPFGDGIEHRFKIVLVNDEIVVDVSRISSHDDHYPYACARITNEPNQWFGVGPFDHAVRLQEELNDHRNIALRTNRFAGPIGFARDTAELPHNLFQHEPGTIYRNMSPGDISWTTIPSTIRETILITEEIRRDLEEVTGALRLLAGGEGGNTATEVDRRYTEANRRIRGYVLNFTICVKKILSNFHSMNRQYIRKDQLFRVLGKKAQGLSVYGKASPEIFQVDVDFEFGGLINLATMGIRAQQLQTWISIISSPAIAPEIRGTINWSGISKELYKLLVNPKVTDDLIVDLGQLDRMVDQTIENTMLRQGLQVAVHPMDDDAGHIKVMEEAEEFDFEDWSPEAQKNFFEHRQLHEAALMNKQARRIAQQQFAPPMYTPGIDPAGGGTTPEGVAGAQLGPAANPSFGQVPGETPGPANGAVMQPTALPGRTPSTFQDQGQLG